MDPITLALAKKYTDKKTSKIPGVFTIYKVYHSVDEMNNGYANDGLVEGSLVLINTGNVEDIDNAKLYIKGPSEYEFLADLSGMEGVEGPKPEKGVDYFTEEDKTEFVNGVLAALPTWEGGSY